MNREIALAAARVRFWSIAGITATAYLQTVFMCHRPWMTAANVTVLAISVVYSLGCIFGQPWCEAKGRPAWNIAYFAVQIPLAAALLFFAPVKGPGVYFLLPLVSQAVFVFPLRVAIGLSAGLFAIALANLFFPYGWRAVVDYIPAYLGGFVFTAGLSHLLMREAAARREAVALQKELEAANVRLRAQAAQAEELAVARERNRFAREIHDGLGHYLTTVAVQAEAARALIPRDAGRAGLSLERIRTLAEQALADVRRSIGLLRGETVPAPLLQQMQALAGTTGVLVEVVARGEPRALPLDVVHALHRAAQEGLTNVQKHALASRATVVVDFLGDDRVRVEIVDDGHAANVRRAGGFGLNGVRERVEALGGRMQAGRGAKGGFVLSVEVPG